MVKYGLSLRYFPRALGYISLKSQHRHYHFLNFFIQFRPPWSGNIGRVDFCIAREAGPIFSVLPWKLGLYFLLVKLLIFASYLTLIFYPLFYQHILSPYFIYPFSSLINHYILPPFYPLSFTHYFIPYFTPLFYPI